MDLTSARQLGALTTAFYQQVSHSFSKTRQAPWAGWHHLVGDFHLTDMESPLRVLDVACGNLRFERYLASCGIVPHAWTLDNCEPLVREGKSALQEACPTSSVAFAALDLAEALLEGADPLEQATFAPISPATLPSDASTGVAVDLAVCFGFMHHLPLSSQRERLISSLVRHTRPGGLAVLSFWQFAQEPRIMARARTFEGAAPGDYLLGWQDRADVARYCHSFDEHELDELARLVSHEATEVARFSADGKSGNLNRYLVLRRT